MQRKFAGAHTRRGHQPSLKTSGPEAGPTGVIRTLVSKVET